MSGQIQIEVSFPPKIISLQKSAIRSGQGLIAEIVCTVTAEPMPKVTWYKGDEVSKHNNQNNTHGRIWLSFLLYFDTYVNIIII